MEGSIPIAGAGGIGSVLAQSMGLAADINRTLTGLIRAAERMRQDGNKSDQEQT